MNQQLLNWLNDEKKKDQLELESSKKSLIKDIKNLNKEDLFKKKKITLWKKIRMMIWGY